MKAVIMAGGQGTRFWPLSVERYPKQFLQIVGKRSMLQETASRLQPLLSPEDIFVVSSQPYVEEIKAQLPFLDSEHLIVEPEGRNTAPCIGLAALQLKLLSGSDEVMVVLPSDHMIRDVAEFHEVLQAAEELARNDWLITFGIQPTAAATGYGYLKRGESVGQLQQRDAFRVDQFLEKPDRTAAERFLEEGGYYWNSGMFVWKIDTILAEIERRMPLLSAGLAEIENSWQDSDRVAAIFGGFEKISIDYGVMEKAERVAVLPCRLGWSDVGNWNALKEFLPADKNGIAANCMVESVDARDCLVFAEDSRLVALIGVQDLVVVDTPNALLICPSEQTEDVKKVVEQLRKAKLDRHL